MSRLSSGVRLAAGPVSGGVVFSKLSKLLNQEDALSVPCLQHFRNYCGAIKVARCGPGAPHGSAGRAGPRKGLSLSYSVCTNCETAYAVIPALRRRALAGRRNAADGHDPSLLISHYRLLHPSHHADKR